MPKHYWLMKTEPGEYSFDDLLREGKTVWDGVRNHQAKKNMTLMQEDDAILIYHSVSQKAVVGLAKLSKTAYPDPTDNPDGRWQVVEIQPVKAFKTPVTLEAIKATPALANIALIRQSRLSVMPLTPDEFETLCELGMQ